MTADWRVIVAMFIGGSVLTVARRWQNDDPAAGAGIAGWTVLAIFVYILGAK